MKQEHHLLVPVLVCYEPHEKCCMQMMMTTMMMMTKQTSEGFSNLEDAKLKVIVISFFFKKSLYLP